MEVFMLEELESCKEEEEAYGSSDEKHFTLGETFLFCGALSDPAWVSFFVYVMA